MYYKVNRCLARYRPRATTTNQPTNSALIVWWSRFWHQDSKWKGFVRQKFSFIFYHVGKLCSATLSLKHWEGEHGRRVHIQNCFQRTRGLCPQWPGCRHAREDRPFIMRQSQLGHESINYQSRSHYKQDTQRSDHYNWNVPEKAFFGPKILIFTGGSESFGTHVTEKPLRHLVRIVFGRALDQTGQKCQSWARFGCFWAKIPLLSGRKCAILTPKFEHLGPIVNFLFRNCDFCQQGILPHLTLWNMQHISHTSALFCPNNTVFDPKSPFFQIFPKVRKLRQILIPRQNRIC